MREIGAGLTGLLRLLAVRRHLEVLKDVVARAGLTDMIEETDS
jgi:hypothetical protein